VVALGFDPEDPGDFGHGVGEAYRVARATQLRSDDESGLTEDLNGKPARVDIDLRRPSVGPAKQEIYFWMD
jgi:hypothetical protein